MSCSRLRLEQRPWACSTGPIARPRSGCAVRRCCGRSMHRCRSARLARRPALPWRRVLEAGGRTSRPPNANGTRRSRTPPLPEEPYPSLAYYDGADRALFTGRDADVVRFAATLDLPDTRILVLHGESGTGQVVVPAGRGHPLPRGRVRRLPVPPRARRPRGSSSRQGPRRRRRAAPARRHGEPVRVHDAGRRAGP